MRADTNALNQLIDDLFEPAIARALVEAHDGKIGVSSQPGQGTRVVFTLKA